MARAASGSTTPHNEAAGAHEEPTRAIRLTLTRLASVAHVPGGPEQADAALRILDQAGALHVVASPRNAGPDVRIIVLRQAVNPRDRIDWKAARRARDREYSKLMWMQRYAYHTGCRRGFVLRYFGDPAAMRKCAACDRCIMAADTLLADARPPRPNRARQLRDAVIRIMR
jgi:hypothetical protein